MFFTSHHADLGSRRERSEVPDPNHILARDRTALSLCYMGKPSFLVLTVAVNKEKGFLLTDPVYLQKAGCSN